MKFFKAFLLLALVLFVTPVHAAIVTCNGIPDSSGNCPLAIDDSGYVTYNGGVYTKYEAATTNDTITAAESGKTFIVTPAATLPVTFILPTASSGLSFTFASATGNATLNRYFELDPQSTDTFVGGLNNSATTTFAAGDRLRSPGTTGDSVSITAIGTSWYVTGMRGTFTDAN